MNGLLIGHIRGIEVRLNWSVLFVVALIAWSLADAVLPEMTDGHTTTAYWSWGVVIAAVFIASLLAHELGHSVVAIQHGVPVLRITLWMLGGVAVLGASPSTPRAGLKIAAAGPAVSAVLGVAATIAAIPFSGLPQAALLWLGMMNLVLMAFNLLPAFPLDGGRMYQAWQWEKTGDELQATKRAAELGLRLGAVLVALGFLQVLLLGSIVGGLWMMMIGWFIREAGRAEWRHQAVVKPLTALPVQQVMTDTPMTVDADTTLESFVAGMFFGGRHAAYPVTDDRGDVVGMITLNDVRQVPHHQHTERHVGEVATPLAELVCTTPATPVSDLLEEMQTRNEARALVFDGDELTGIVSPSDITRLLSVMELAGAVRVNPSQPAADS